MTQEQKQLLLRDLCARLPYGVVCKISYTFNNETTGWEDVESTCDDIITKINFDTKEVFSDWLSEYSSIDDVKPYLRPMSSITDEEKEEIKTLGAEFSPLNSIRFRIDESENDGFEYGYQWLDIFDFLNKHHFDYRGLIPIGLALEAPEDMYKTE